MTDPDLQAAAYRIFAEALDLPPEERHRLIVARCADNHALRTEVLGLLGAALADADSTAAFRTLPPTDEAGFVGLTVGRFKLIERVGSGGMGVVYRAERTDGVLQSVAIKLLSNELDKRARTRFEHEAQLLARLEHPAIARFIDAGIRDERAWIAIEFVKGRRIDAYCDERSLGVREIVRLVIDVAEAVASAHSMLVVHSDIKPGNVLVNVEGAPKLVDFGIATALRDAGEDHPTAGRGTRMFSPNYASPEQIEGGVVTVATDVFGLGALAYRLLTGCAPYADAADPLAYVHAVRQNAAQSPSSAARAAGRDWKLVRALRGDLEAIVQKAMSRNPASRYATARDFAADLGRYLGNRPVQARPASVAFRAYKFTQRHAVAAGAAFVLLLGTGVGVAIYAVQERSVAQAQKMAARRDEFLESLLKSANPNGGKRDITVAQVLDASAQGLDGSLGKEPLVEASMLGVIASTNGSLGRYEQGFAASDRELALLREHGGSDLELARALVVRGELYRAHGLYAEAQPPLRQALSLLARLSDVDADRGRALDELGMALVYTANEREAETVLRQAVALETRIHSDTAAPAEPMQNLGVLLMKEVRYPEAEQLLSRAVEILRRHAAPDDPNVLMALGNYASCLTFMRQPAKAEPLLREALARSARVLGPTHTDTLTVQRELGQTLTILHRYAEAEALLRPAAEELERNEGPANNTTMAAWSSLAINQCQGGDPVGGLVIARRVADIRKQQSMLEGDWHVAAIRTVEGLCLVHLKHYAEAEPILAEARARLEKARGPDHFTTQLNYEASLALYAATGRPDQAEAFGSKILH